MHPIDVEPIRLVERDGHLITIDNRRLEAFRRADVNVPARLATPGRFGTQSTKKSLAPDHLVRIASALGENDRMTIAPVLGFRRIHSTPEPSIQVKDLRVIIDLDDEEEKRFRIIFHPYQAMRLTTIDCFAVANEEALLPNVVMEVKHSSWIEALTSSLKQVDETATFMARARHFIVPLQDDILEVVAWDIVLAEKLTP